MNINLEFITNSLKKNTPLNKIIIKNNNNELEYQKHKKKLYNACMNMIQNETLRGNFDIFFNIPKTNELYLNYEPKECLLYIQKKLRDDNFHTLICNNASSIFISWKHLI
jgi:hypothetical protein